MSAARKPPASLYGILTRHVIRHVPFSFLGSFGAGSRGAAEKAVLIRARTKIVSLQIPGEWL
jgi:hypothetical protein